MSDLIERELREAFASRVDAVAPRIVDRLSSTDFHPRRTRARLLTKLGACGSVIAAAATAVTLGLTGGTPVAFAGWTATPSPASAAAVEAARSACGHAAASDVLASEARGPYTAIVFLKRDRPWQCVVKGSEAVVDLSTPYPLRAYSKVPADKVMVPLLSRRTFGKTLRRLNRFATTWSASRLLAVMTGPGSVSVALGIAGENVTAVTLTLKDGKQVHATVQHGWYVAWWPGAPMPGGAETTSIAVTTSSRTHSSRLPAAAGNGPYNLDAKGCFPGDACSVLVPLQLTPGIAPSVRRHFAIFSDTPAVKLSTLPRALRRMIEQGTFDDFAGSRSVIGEVQMQNGLSNGLDPAQTRGIKLNGSASIWFIPGTEGYCYQLELLHFAPGGLDVSDSSCSTIKQLLRTGYIQATPGGPLTYAIGGFVPNGNTTVAVHLDSGATRIIRVRHNTFVGHFESDPTTVTLKNAFGRTITEPVSTNA